MQIAPNTPTATRKIEGIDVVVPQPYAEGMPLTPALAAILNQTFAENISNNLRARLKVGTVTGEGDNAVTTPHDSASAQRLVDDYITGYEPGVKRGGGEPRVTDPVEKEARTIARQKASELVRSRGLKPGDVDMAEVTGKIFEAHKEQLMAAAKKIVAAREKNSGGELDLGAIEVAAKPPSAPAQTEGEQVAAG